jgi:hypothetical protein
MNNLGQPTENEIALSLIETYCDTCNAVTCAGCPVFAVRGTPNKVLQSDGGWACAKCGYLNNVNHSKCHSCGATRRR